MYVCMCIHTCIYICLMQVSSSRVVLEVELLEYYNPRNAERGEDDGEIVECCCNSDTCASSAGQPVDNCPQSMRHIFQCEHVKL